MIPASEPQPTLFGPDEQPDPERPKPPRPAETRERSAGVLVFREVPDPDKGGEATRRLYLLLDYGRHWDYPKGHLEAGEDDRTAALRELKEETNLDQVEIVDGFSHEISYRFHSARNRRVHKTVVFFAAKLVGEPNVTLSHEHVGYAWVAREAALEQLKFENARAVLRAASAFLDAPI